MSRSVKHACTRLGNILEGKIKKSVAALAESELIKAKLTKKDQDLIVGFVINTIEDELCS